MRRYRDFILLLVFPLLVSAQAWSQLPSKAAPIPSETQTKDADAETDDEEEEPLPTRMTPKLLWRLGRLSGATIVNDGKHVVYGVRRYKLKDNAGATSIYVYDVETAKTRELLSGWPSIGGLQSGKSPFGERIFFTGKPDKKDGTSTQVWSLNPLDGGIVQVTDIEDGVGNLKVSPTGDHIAFTLDIKLDDDVTELYEDLPEADARIIDSLMYRHWNAWHDYKYTHLHVAPLGETGRAEEAVDLMEGMKVDCPVPPFGGSEQFNWSPDGKQIAFTMKDVEKWAESTDSSVYLVDVANPGSRRNITEGMPGYDNDPVFSPDGSLLAFHSMERASFESDRNRIMIYDNGRTYDATKGLDQTAHSAKWTPYGDTLVFVSEHRGTNQVFEINKQGEDGTARKISSGQFNWNVVEIFPDGKQALVSFSSMIRPYELAIMDLKDGSTKTISDINGEIYANLNLAKVEEMWTDATDGKKIHSWVIYPPNFDPNKKYPLITYCQGGPQGQIGQWFSYRWNFHLMAAQGYIVVAPNRRGLPGFGRKWNDDISKDWGGQCMKDILSVTDEMLAKPYVDRNRTAAVGASFGGYTVYWMMGNHDNRYKCMIAHCGVFNLESMYGSTEELFFVNWDLGGPYWRGGRIAEDYKRFSPHNFVKNWQTPLFVIHGEKDFRVPVTQGMEAFTAAQVQNVPSRFLYFPEEGHWVLGPQNGVLWHRLFFDWLDRYCKEAK